MKRNGFLSIITWFIMIGMVLVTISCAINPVSGRPDLMLVSNEDEIKLGQQTDTGVTGKYGLYDDQKLTGYVDEMGQHMGKLSHRPELDWHFKILDASVVNAFAAPGGYVYLTRGILATLNSEAELAGIMGHEIGHVTARHSAQQISKAKMAQFGLVGVSIGLSILGIPGLSSLAELGVGVLFLKFSRDDEREADSLGVEYATKAGYDASQMADFFETLKRMESKSDRSGLPSWFSTHPSPEDRERAIRTQSKQMQQTIGLKDAKIDRENYLRTIDGIVYGDDSRQGYVEGGVYYHPTMRIQFPVPTEWEVSDTQAAVQMVSKKKDAVIIFGRAAGTTPSDAAQKYISKTGARVLKSDETHVNGLSAQWVVADVTNEKGTIKVMSCFIQKEKEIFGFHGVSSLRLFPQYESLFAGAMKGFKELSDPKKINIQPNRIRARFTKKTNTIEDALRELGVPDHKLKDIVILNGMTPGQNVPAHTLLKVIERGR
ncbi:MAG: M48 family metalloprotease [Syntrophaceae bacterium]